MADKGKGSGAAEGSGGSKPAAKLTEKGIQELLEMNPSLKAEMSGLTPEKAAETLRKMDVADLLTGMSMGGKNQKDMASYKFWQTQPVPRFDETGKKVEDGPIKNIDIEEVHKQPQRLIDGFEWCTMDLTDEKETREVFELLTEHYVEDGEAMFRLNYSAPFLNWALKAPGWRKEWHIGVRASKSRRLVAFISAIPVTVKVRANTLKCAEVNFLCVHKKLRSRRLAPLLIEEITRQCYLVGVYQAVYTAGTVVPTPISSCRYFHRPLNWPKLHDVGFSPLPPGSTTQRQITRNYLPPTTSIAGLRLMEKKDVPAVCSLLQRYGKRFALAPMFSEDEVSHWFYHDPETTPEQVVWTYVVEDPRTEKITDFSSFYVLPSKIIGNPKFDHLKAAYSFYYATEAAFKKDEKFFKERLNSLILDTLVMAKKFDFDVFNALTMMDNPLFLEQQKFGKGDGQLHYYLFNYRTALIPGGVDSKNNVDEKMRGGIGMALF